jgi:predicted O-linked N-acetylglucosamine transferase (SPINDLY family)
MTNGHVTFGCLNNFCKINEPVLELWAKVLGAVPDSQLVLLADPGTHRERVLQSFHRQGINAAQRVQFVPKTTREKYLEYFHQIDIALDTFPYNGHTTSLDGFWMGVPVVTLVGHTIVGRAGLSQLSNLSLMELVANDKPEFVRIAAELAGDIPRLENLRSSLRSRMQASPLMDAPRFARNIEQAYGDIWRRWVST